MYNCTQPVISPLVHACGVLKTKIQKSTGYLDDGYCKEEELISEVFVRGTEPRLLANCSRSEIRRERTTRRRPQQQLPSAYEIIGDIIRRIWN